MTECSAKYPQLLSLNIQKGLSLIELTIVLLIMMALAGLILPSFNEVPAYAQCTATKSTMKAIRDALLGDISGGGYVDDMGEFPDSLTELFTPPPPFSCSDPSKTDQASCETAGETWQSEKLFNPVTGMGWRGPYMQEVTTINASSVTGGNFDLTATPLTHIDPPVVAGDTGVLGSFVKNGVRRPIVIQNSTTNFVRLVSAGRDGELSSPITDLTLVATVRKDDLVLYLKISDPTPIAAEDDQTGCSLTD